MTPQQFAKFTPAARTDIVAALVNGYGQIVAGGINTPPRLWQFLANIAAETGGFTIYVENMNYSAQRLTEVWPTHFKTLDFAKQYEHDPEKLANYIYADANRLPAYRLGNTQPGDGWKYRGRSLIQNTGRAAYTKIGYADNPDALADPRIGLTAAIAEFVDSGCLALADKGDTEGVRRRINGGLNGIEAVRMYLDKAKTVFPTMGPVPVAVPTPTPRPTPAPTTTPPPPPTIVTRPTLPPDVPVPPMVPMTPPQPRRDEPAPAPVKAGPIAALAAGLIGAAYVMWQGLWHAVVDPIFALFTHLLGG